jgi:hypothetical protein
LLTASFAVGMLPICDIVVPYMFNSFQPPNRLVMIDMDIKDDRWEFHVDMAWGGAVGWVEDVETKLMIASGSGFLPSLKYDDIPKELLKEWLQRAARPVAVPRVK